MSDLHKMLQRATPSDPIGEAYDRTPAGLPPGPPMAANIFVVTVEKDGYDAEASPNTEGAGGKWVDGEGSGHENCTWTYTVKDYWSGDVLTMADGSDAEDLTPAHWRIAKCEYSAGTVGLATRNADGDIVLLMVFNESPGAGVC